MKARSNATYVTDHCAANSMHNGLFSTIHCTASSTHNGLISAIHCAAKLTHKHLPQVRPTLNNLAGRSC
jgi:hypothetical protein